MQQFSLTKICSRKIKLIKYLLYYFNSEKLIKFTVKDIKLNILNYKLLYFY